MQQLLDLIILEELCFFFFYTLYGSFCFFSLFILFEEFFSDFWFLVVKNQLQSVQDLYIYFVTSFNLFIGDFKFGLIIVEALGLNCSVNILRSEINPVGANSASFKQLTDFTDYNLAMYSP